MDESPHHIGEGSVRGSRCASEESGDVGTSMATTVCPLTAAGLLFLSPQGRREIGGVKTARGAGLVHCVADEVDP